MRARREHAERRRLRWQFLRRVDERPLSTAASYSANGARRRTSAIPSIVRWQARSRPTHPVVAADRAKSPRAATSRRGSRRLDAEEGHVPRSSRSTTTRRVAFDRVREVVDMSVHAPAGRRSTGRRLGRGGNGPSGSCERALRSRRRTSAATRWCRRTARCGSGWVRAVRTRSRSAAASSTCSHRSRRNPIRIELFGDEVESLRWFDAESQRTLREVDHVILHPVRETITDRVERRARARARLRRRDRVPDRRRPAA